MKILVTYKSKTGFAKKYAEMIAKETGADMKEFKEVTAEIMSGYDTVVYGAGLYAGMINGFTKAKEMFGKSSAKKFILFATGGTPNELTDKIEEVWKTNLKDDDAEKIPHFYMQGGMCYEKMSFSNKMLMKMMAGVLSKQQNKDVVDEGFEQAIKSSYDISSEEFAQPLIDYLKEQ